MSQPVFPASVETEFELPVPAAMLSEACDLLIVLDADDKVAEVRSKVQLGENVTSGWIGRALSDIVTPECAAKVPKVLGNNCADGSGDGRWRHLNFLDGGAGLPLIVKYFELKDEAPARLIAARDLRPLSELQISFQSLQSELERCREQRVQGVADLSDQLVNERLCDLGQKSLATMVKETVQALERRCISTALAQCRGDESAAARLLGLGLADFMRRVKELESGLSLRFRTDN